MEEWKEYKLGDVVIPVRDRIETSNLDISSYISTENMLPNKAGVTLSSGIPSGNAIKFENGDVLISNIRPYFKKIWRADKVGGCSADVICLRASEKLDSLFLYYLLSQDLFFDYVMQGSKGTKMPRGDKNQIMQWPVLIPSKSHQKKIASILKSLDDKIEVNRRINDNLEQQARTLFKYWFIDFEPFRNGEFEEIELGTIPKGWRISNVEEHCNVFTGRKNVDKSSNKGKYPFFSCSPSHSYSDEYIYNGEAILVAGNGSYTGRTSYYIGKFDLYQRTYACVMKEGETPQLSSFIYFMMKTLFEPNKIGGTRGSSIPYIVMGDITRQSFPYNEDIVKKYSDIAYNILLRIQGNEQETHRLVYLRDTLLPPLLSGEINVTNTDLVDNLLKNN